MPQNYKKWLLALSLASSCGLFVQASGSFQLHDPGREAIVDYEKYGVFIGTGTGQYRYYIRDRMGLADAVGEGDISERGSPQARSGL